MPNIWTPDAIQIFILFVVPGFISIKIYELFFPCSETDSSKKIIDAISFGSINFGILYIPISLVENSTMKSSCWFGYFIFYLFVIFLAPALWVWIWRKIRLSYWFQSRAPHPTQKPWDFVFSQRKEYWVIATLKNGKKIAGWYGYNSFASSTPASEQIYLEQSWELNSDGRFEKRHEQTAGVIILSKEIEVLELFNN